MGILKKHKIKIIAAASIILVLAIVWFYEGMRGNDIVVVNPLPPNEFMEEGYGYELDCEPDFEEEYETDENLDENVGEEDITPDVTEVDEIVTANAEQSSVNQLVPDTPVNHTVRAPVEPGDMVVGDDWFYVTLSARVDTLLNNMHLLHRDKHELVPDDGVIFFSANVRAYEGESVFNVLQREMRRTGIHMSSRFTPGFNSAYIEAINNIFELDGGPLSGWMYRVNGWFPNFGSSRYLLQPGDVIEWMYTVDLGRDVGGEFLSDR